MTAFEPNCLPLLIGSLPMTDHNEATQLVIEHTPHIPLWVQLPAYPEEGMIQQFLPGLPGLTHTDGKSYIDDTSATFENELVAFYEEYVAICESPHRLQDSRFALSEDAARGFFALEKAVETGAVSPRYLKGQITGPITMGLGITDSSSRVLFYNDRLRDVLVKTIALKARWQAERFSRLGHRAIIFFDEPGLASYGSSAFISISREQILDTLSEVATSLHDVSAIAGIHICANADWSLALETSIDILSFDAYSYFDKFILYPDLVKRFLDSGRVLAWGIIPTSDPTNLDKVSVDSLYEQWLGHARHIEQLGVPLKKIASQSLITPSCGTGSLTLPQARTVLGMTRDLSCRLRQTFFNDNSNA